jgi:LytS/YehU family sensor histidine kinase
MKKLIDISRIKLFLWIGLAYMLLALFSDAGNHSGSFIAKLVNNSWATVYVTFFNFILFEYTIPFIKLRWKRILLGVLFIWAHLMFYSFGLYAWRFIGIQLHIYSALMIYSSRSQGLQLQMAFSAMSICFFGFTRHFYDFRKLKIAAQQLRIEKQQAELNYLKSQTNPHFLFNTLNNIYALARDKSSLTPESILRLSKILRFMLYETGGEYIAIESELKIIDDYIALEKLRYDETLSINFNHDIEDMKQALPPLLLIPLIENAFKYGVSETRAHPFVDIHLSVKNRILTFVVKNSTEQYSEDQGVKVKIGLSNLRRQLELLYTDYNLSIQQGESMFTASLNINLASHV